MSLLGGIVGGITGAIGSTIGKGDDKRALEIGEQSALENLRLWGQLKVPTIEEQQIILQNPDLMGQYTPEQIQYMQLNASAMDQVGADPQTIEAQNDALRQLQEVSKGGFTEADKATAREIQRTVSQDAQARQKAILNAMAQRGTLGSGMELAAQLQGAQQATEQMSRGGEGLTQQAQARALQALGQQGSLAGQMRQQQVGEQADIARAKDEISRFNLANRQRVGETNVGERNRAQLLNLQQQQARENQRATLANQQQMYNKDLIQQNYRDRLAKLQGQLKLKSQFADAQAASATAGAERKRGAFEGIVGGAIQGGTGGFGFANGGLVDENMMSDINNLGLMEQLRNLPQLPETFPQQNQMSQPMRTVPIPVQPPTMTQDLPQPTEPQKNDPVLEELLKQRQMKQAGANFLDVLSTSMRRPQTLISKSLREQAGQPIEDYKTKEEFKSRKTKEATEEKLKGLQLGKLEQEIEKEKASNDPDSELSNQIRQLVIERHKQLGRDIPEDQLKMLSANQLQQAFKYLDTDIKDLKDKYKFEESLKVRKDAIAAQKENAAATWGLTREKLDLLRDAEGRREKYLTIKEEKEERSKKRDISKDIYGVIKDFEKDDTTKALKKEDLSFAQADQLIAQIESGNEVALGALGTKMARAMGEVGVLTESDVSRYIEAQSLVQKAKDKFGRAFMGNLSAKTLQDIKEVTQKMKEGFKKRKSEIQEKYIDYAHENFGKDVDMSREEISQRFGLGPSTPTTMIKMRDPKGNIRMIPQNQVEQAIAAGGEVVK